MSDESELWRSRSPWPLRLATDGVKADCPTCEGSGRIAGDRNGEVVDDSPWSFWQALPIGSDLAVQAGVVAPMLCPSCRGTGSVWAVKP